MSSLHGGFLLVVSTHNYRIAAFGALIPTSMNNNIKFDNSVTALSCLCTRVTNLVWKLGGTRIIYICQTTKPNSPFPKTIFFFWLAVTIMYIILL